ncbi:hypothetical protein D3C80_761030 [compost metagenome]
MNINKPSPYSLAGFSLVDMGYSAIPVMPGSKRPGSMSFGNWYGDMDWSRFCDRLPTEIETSIWGRWQDAGVCVAIDKSLKVIDIDTDDSEIIEAIKSVLPPILVAKKGKKGLSVFYRGSENIVSRPFNLQLEGGFETRVVDLLAHGRQTVVPPTVHPDTEQPYIWITEDTLADTSIEDLPELPDDVAERLTEVLERFGTVPKFRPRGNRGEEVFGESIWREVNNFALANLDSWVPALFGVDAKRKRDGTYRARASWRGVENFNVGITPDGITDWGASETHTPIDLVMSAINTNYFEPAYEWLVEKTGYVPDQNIWEARAAENVKRIMASTERKLADLAQKKAAETGSTPETEQTIVEAVAAPVRAPRSRMDPFDPASAGGLMEVIANWVLDTARSPVREFAIMTAASFVGTLFSRRVVGPTGAGLNMYMVGVAGPGFGKEHPHKTLQTLALDAGVQHIIGPGEVTSGTAIEKVVRKRPAFIMPWDEIGVVLQSVNGNGSTAWAKTIRKVLLEIFSKSTSIWSGKEHADPTTDSSATPVHCPTVSLLGMSTPTEFYKGLTEATLSDGFLARLLVIEARERPQRKRAAPLLVTPASLIGHVKKAQESLPTPGNAADFRIAEIKPPLFFVPWENEEAELRWIAIEDWQIAQIEDHGAHDGMIGRSAEHTIKLATVRALSRNPSNPKVSLEDVEWGYAVVQRSIDSLEVGVKEYMFGSQFEELCKSIMTAIRKAKDGKLAHSKLVGATGVSKRDEREVKAAIDRLVVAGEIYKPEASSRGVVYRLMYEEAA